MKRQIALIMLILTAAPAFSMGAETSTSTAGIYAYLDVFIEQFGPDGKVTYSSWGNLGFGFLWSNGIEMKDGKFEGNAFSGTWDYTDPSIHHSGKINVVLDDVIEKATKVMSFSGEDVSQYVDGSRRLTVKIGGVGGSLPAPTRTTSPSGNVTTTFQIDGSGTCGSVTSFSSELIPYVDWLVHTIVGDYRCNGQSRLMIQFVTSDPCAGKIPLPKGISSYDLEGVSSYSAAVPSPVLGSDPEKISPLGFGSKTEDGSPSSYQVKLCAFEKPVDLYFEVVPYWGYYFLDQSNKAVPLEKLKPLRTNVTGPVDIVIPGDFGGLFNGGRIAKGEYGFQIIALPAGANFLSAKDAYFWKYVVDTKCNGSISMPTGREFFGIDEPLALPVTGDDPEQIIPLSVGHYGLGGEMLIMGVEFCPFDERVDIHFGIYCPEDDPLHYYFVNGDAKQEKDLFQKVPMLKLPFSGKLPTGSFEEDDSFDISQEDQTNLFVAAPGSKLPKGSCQYIAAVTPVGVRDKFYAWVMPFDRNIKKAFIELWKNSQKTGGPGGKKRER